jgi:diadenosine tetraphosphate (Ap4A) HIT family hydrolase
VTGLDHLWAGWRSEYIEGVTAKPERDVCFFCALQELDNDDALILERTDTTFTLMNAYPYTSGHLLVAPLRHEATLVDLRPEETTDLMFAIQRANRALLDAYRPGGINVGANVGRAAGAGVPGHVHVHALPRWDGDTNFMTSVAQARVLPESLRTSYEKLAVAWPARADGR